MAGYGMPKKASTAFAICALVSAGSSVEAQKSVDRSVNVAALKAVGEVDERFLAYNVESVEVTGGNFWAPYPRAGETAAKGAAGPHGVEFSSGSYQKRDPIDLTRKRLRMLTRALGPSYMRVSGSWANSIYFQDDDKIAGPPPAGYQGVLTRAQWAGVVAFGKAVDAKILTSFAISEGARDKNGAWNPDQARRLFAYTKSLGGHIDAVELANEPNVGRKPYDAALYAKDMAALRSLVTEVSPTTKLVGPGSTGEAGFKLFAAPPEEISTARLLSGTPSPRFDVFSHHFYGAVSQRCKSLGERNNTIVTTTRGEALSEAWLARADQAQTYYKGVRDRFAPDAPMWLTETAQTACGGDPWSSTFVDSFRFVDQLGRLARNGASMIFHNTLAASDYALIDDRTWLPRPNYWAALLWHRLMGKTVLDAGANDGSLHVYAHCRPGKAAGVSLVAVNLSSTDRGQLTLPVAGSRYTLSSTVGDENNVWLNGRRLELGKGDALPALRGATTKAGPAILAPLTISFFELAGADNAACRP